MTTRQRLVYPDSYPLEEVVLMQSLVGKRTKPSVPCASCRTLTPGKPGALCRSCDPSLARRANPTEAIDLCSSELLPLLWPKEAPRQNPPIAALGVRPGADAYLTLEECEELVRAVFAHFGVNEPCPISWMRAERRAGVAQARRSAVASGSDVVTKVAYAISFSQPVFKAVNADSRVDTVIHESCHIVDIVRNGPRRNNRDGHGPAWQNLMRECGIAPNAKMTESIPSLQAIATCPKCKTASTASIKLVRWMQNGGSGVCRKCAAELTAENLKVPEKVAKRAAAAEKRTGSRIYECECGARMRLGPKHWKLAQSDRSLRAPDEASAAIRQFLLDRPMTQLVDVPLTHLEEIGRVAQDRAAKRLRQLTCGKCGKGLLWEQVQSLFS